MTDYTESIQAFINDCYNDIGALPDEVIEDAVDEYWETIPDDVYDIQLYHPGIKDALLIIEINEDGEIRIHRVYANPEDEELDEYQLIDAGEEDDPNDDDYVPADHSEEDEA